MNHHSSNQIHLPKWFLNNWLVYITEENYLKRNKTPPHSAFGNLFSCDHSVFSVHMPTSGTTSRTSWGWVWQDTTQQEKRPWPPGPNPSNITEKSLISHNVGYSRLSFHALVSSYVVGRDIARELATRTDWPLWQEELGIPPSLEGCMQHFQLIPSSEAQVVISASIIVIQCHEVANVCQILARQWR